MKGLIIHSNWLDLILAGEKTWELRSAPTKIRGPIALIRKGTGQVYAVADLVEVGAELTKQELVQFFTYHRVPPSFWEPFEEFSWRYPWKLQNVNSLHHPIPYFHRNGAVIWAELNPECVSAIQDELLGKSIFTATEKSLQLPIGEASVDLELETPTGQNKSEKEKASEISGHDFSVKNGVNVRKLVLSQGNINNGHFYLRTIADWLPNDVIGGSRIAEKAPMEMIIHWGGGSPASTDVAGDKMIFRSRGWVKSFFTKFELKAGDSIFLEKSGEYEIKIYPQLQK